MATIPAGARDERFDRTLTTPKIVFIIIAAAAPLAAMVFTVPLSLSLGTGPSAPALFVFAGLTLLCFSAGYAAIGQRISHAGGFYTYIAHGLGRPLAVGAGQIAVIAYNTVTIGVLGAFAYFAQYVAASHGLHLPWEFWAGAGILVVGTFGYRNVEFSARLLALFMMCEITILSALDLAILIRHGGAALPTSSFAPHSIMAPGLGVSVMFGFGSFIGFESAALYGEEARDPKRSVPRATIIAVLVVAAFYAFTSWVAVGAIGTGHVREVAAQHLNDLFFNLSNTYLDGVATTVMQVLVCTSLFAAWLALHNAANRYAFVLARDRVLPRRLDAVHMRQKSVHRASLLQSVISSAVVAGFAAAGLDPYLNMSTSMLGLGTLGVVVLQALASMAVLGYYRRRRGHWWRTRTAPALGALGLVTATFLVVRNFSVLVGTSDPVVTMLPWLLVIAGVGGGAYALRLRRVRPDLYAHLAAMDTATTGTPDAADKTRGAEVDTPADHQQPSPGYQPTT